MDIPEIDPDELRRRLDGPAPPLVLDVREDEEVAAVAFPGARHIPMGELADRTGELPTDRDIVVVCAAGVRSATVTAALVRAGWPAVNLAGGMAAWGERPTD
jgi:rhodanese-related sulfurtransferase